MTQERRRSTAAQVAARTRNWSWRMVLGAASTVCRISTPLGNPEDDADLKIAQEALGRIHRRHRDRYWAREEEKEKRRTNPTD